jgi:hypothetical protein
MTFKKLVKLAYREKVTWTHGCQLDERFQGENEGEEIVAICEQRTKKW